MDITIRQAFTSQKEDIHHAFTSQDEDIDHSRSFAFRISSVAKIPVEDIVAVVVSYFHERLSSETYCTNSYFIEDCPRVPHSFFCLW